MVVVGVGVSVGVSVGVGLGEDLFMGFSVPEQMVEDHIVHGNLYKEGATSEAC